MASVTTATPPTGPDAPAPEEKGQQEQNQQQQQQAPDRPDWLPEKFATPEEFAASYGELEKKLSQSGEEKPAGEEKEGAESKDEEGKQEQQTEEQVVSKALSDAGLDQAALTSEFEADGKLSDASYEALDKAGYPKEMVDVYLRGLQNPAEGSEQTSSEAEQALQEADLKEIKSVVGTDAEFEAVQAWAKTNLDPEDLNTYNNMVSQGDKALAKAGVEWLKGRYESAEGSEGAMVSGKPAGQSTDVFRSSAEVTRAMADPRYKTDPAYRSDVIAKIGRSSY